MKPRVLSMFCFICVLLGMFAFNAHGQASVQDGLVAWFPFNETAGPVAANLAGPENGSYQGNVVPVTGYMSNALQFDGYNDYVSVNHYDAVNFGTGDFSIAAWIKTGDSNGNIVSKRHSHNSPGYLFMVYGRRLLLQMTDDIHGWANRYDYNGVIVADNQWRHVAVTVNRDDVQGGKFYVDGNVVYTFDPTVRSGSLDTSANLWIGQEGGGGADYSGTIDEVRLYNRCLSAEDIGDVMQAGTQNIADFSVFALNSMYMRSGVTVNSGNVGVLDVSPGPRLGDSSEIVLSYNVFMEDGVSMYADKIKILPDSSVDDVYCNELANHGTIRGDENLSLSLPLDVTLPEFPAPQPGTADITIGEYETQTLAPGAYGEILVNKKGILLLSGGAYHFENLNLADYAEVRFGAAAQVIIANRLESGIKPIIGPAEGSGIDAGDIVFYVNGINGIGGGLYDLPKAVTIGIRHSLKANIYAPNGTLWLKARGFSEGAFIGKDVMIDYYVQVTLNTIF